MNAFVTSVGVYHLTTTGPRRTAFAGFLEELDFCVVVHMRGEENSSKELEHGNTKQHRVISNLHLHTLFEGDPCISDHGAEVTHSC